MNRRGVARFAVLGVVALLTLPGAGTVRGQPMAPETPVARVLGGTLTLRDIELFGPGPGNLGSLAGEEGREQLRFAAACLVAGASTPRSLALAAEPAHANNLRVIRRKALRDLLWHVQVNDRVSVTDAEVAAYYEAHRNDYYQVGHWVEFKHIFCAKDAEQTEDARTRIEAAWSRLGQGALFDAVAAEFSDAPDPTRVIRDYVENLGLAVRAPLQETAEGAYSKPFETEFGWEIVFVTQAPAMRYEPLEDAAQSIRETLLSDKRSEAIGAFDAYLDSRYPVEVLVDFDAVMQAGESTPLLRVGGKTYTKRDLLGFLADEGVDPGGLDRPEVVQRAVVNCVRDARLWQEIEDTRFDETDLARRALELQRAAYLGRRAIAGMAQEIAEATPATERDLVNYYERNAGRFTKPEQLEGREIVLRFQRPGEDLTLGQLVLRQQQCNEEMERIVARLDQGEDFAALAREVSQSPTAAEGGLLPLEEEKRGRFVVAVSQLEPGEISSVEKSPDELYLYKLEKRVPAERLPYETVKDEVIELWEGARFAAARTAVIDRLLQEGNFEILDEAALGNVRN